jgi:DNA-binding MarR family transcriptional regulator
MVGGELVARNLSLLDYLDAEGQIIRLLANGAATAGEVYRAVEFSQPVVSKKFARLQDEGVIVSERDPNDRRVIWYRLSPDFNLVDNLDESSLALPITDTKNCELQDDA